MAGITPDKLIWVIIFLVPGFVASRIYALRCPSQKLDWDKAVLEFLAYSLFNLIGSFWLVMPILKTTPEEWVGWQLSLVGLWVCFVSPTFLALVWSWLRTRSWIHHKLGMDHPVPRGWDYFLLHNRHFWVLFHLKEGKLLGGYFGERSFASTYPQEPEIYVEQVWRVDEEGHFVEMVSGTLGAVLRQTDWERIEFQEIQYEENSNGSKLSEGCEGGITAIAGGVGGAGPAGAEQQPSDSQPAKGCSTPGRIGYGTTTGTEQTQEIGVNHAPRT